MKETQKISVSQHKKSSKVLHQERPPTPSQLCVDPSKSPSSTAESSPLPSSDTTDEINNINNNNNNVTTTKSTTLSSDTKRRHSFMDFIKRRPSIKLMNQNDQQNLSSEPTNPNPSTSRDSEKFSPRIDAFVEYIRTMSQNDVDNSNVEKSTTNTAVDTEKVSTPVSPMLTATAPVKSRGMSKKSIFSFLKSSSSSS